MDQDRIAALCDELLRRGVPREVVQPVVDWFDAQQAPGLIKRTCLHLWAEARMGQVTVWRCKACKVEL